MLEPEPDSFAAAGFALGHHSTDFFVANSVMIFCGKLYTDFLWRFKIAVIFHEKSKDNPKEFKLTTADERKIWVE